MPVNDEIYDELHALALRLGEALAERGLTCATAESCTGGGIGAALTSVSGSSAWYLGGVVAYANSAKTALLGVDEDALEEHGAVSEPVVRAMAEGARLRLGADLAVAVSGIAGPTGGTADKPVGTVWLAWAAPGDTRAGVQHFGGDREAVRAATIRAAIAGLLQDAQR